MMKKVFAVLLLALICLSFASCTKTVTISGKKYETADGKIFISDEEFATYISQTQLTCENWKDYFAVKDNFLFIKIKTPYTVAQLDSRNFSLKIKDIKTGEIFDVAIRDNGVCYDFTSPEKVVSIADYECVSIGGTLVTATVPPELWQKADPKSPWEPSEEGTPVIYVGNATDSTWYTLVFGNGNDLREYLA
ncbi:MAG: hypothetical protein J6A68_01645 [Oscillospiraceae bacterium]|nr:hypothetical protein [Oscillospiraceae bacterium]